MLNLLLLLDPRRLILTEFPAERAASSEEMAAFLKSRLGVERIPEPRQAYAAAQKGLKENDVLLVTGSFFLLREICAEG
jgi:folylpolyglutamate synthase/dihydropteroate synthase